jgi:hypothetical protein
MMNRVTHFAVILNLCLYLLALADPTRSDTFFAPTNAGIESLLAWGGFRDKAKVGA